MFHVPWQILADVAAAHRDKLRADARAYTMRCEARRSRSEALLASRETMGATTPRV